ncbi:MAG: hypothetical protein NC078_08860 [Ruminococcus sp.]|nr:hypothetical protein [Ruminococcus sp.]
MADSNIFEFPFDSSKMAATDITSAADLTILYLSSIRMGCRIENAIQFWIKSLPKKVVENSDIIIGRR